MERPDTGIMYRISKAAVSQSPDQFPPARGVPGVACVVLLVGLATIADAQPASFVRAEALTMTFALQANSADSGGGVTFGYSMTASGTLRLVRSPSGGFESENGFSVDLLYRGEAVDNSDGSGLQEIIIPTGPPNCDQYPSYISLTPTAIEIDLRCWTVPTRHTITWIGQPWFDPYIPVTSLRWHPGAMILGGGGVFTVPYPASGDVAQGTVNTTGLLVGLSRVFTTIADGDPHDLSFSFTYQVAPAGEPRLEVSSEQYRDWLPSATRNGKPGDPIRFTATLVNSDGSTPQIALSSVEWELIDTSKEPGISMNWPVLLNEGDGADFDLRFKPEGPQLLVDEHGQKLLSYDPQGASDSAVIEPLDWGGWSVLRVTAKADGQTFVGEYKDDRASDIRLPRRDSDSFIGNKWKEIRGVSGADTEDSEREPEGEPGCLGDGLTLYEEYRGFYEEGQHISADPKKKDLFIFNNCGGIALPGIRLFERVSGLKVHHRMLRDERCHSQVAAGDDDTINAYRAQGPHRVNQHRVDLLVCGTTKSRGGGTKTKAGADGDGHLRPKDVENLYVEGPDATFWGEQYGVRTADASRQFDVAVAHELLHAVGVEHHGDGDYRSKLEILRAGSPGNHTGQDGLFEATLAGYRPIRIFEEQSGRDITAALVARGLAWLARVRPVADQEFPPSANPEQERWKSVNLLQVGVANGEQSGAESCVMRYWIADAFAKAGDAPNLYLVPDGTEPIGLSLCDTTEGATINAQGRQPQPRYFDAAPGRGRCKRWVCPNDAIPGKPG